ncbi:Inositol polyphosphate kinase family protein [Aspergillus niger]|uniref:Polynucleotide 5'-hydroxyl-kinase GRC3 n=1 Tax=Aspergillus niger TaxID=5061 RepID=A0A505HLI1_ASPNG|nr:Inositol polyphosphate kinase family protein [Aspergillus niger]
MSLPGLDLTQPSADREFAPAPPSQISLPKGSEWRFEVAFGTTVRVKLLAGTAELFGTELAPSQTYTFSGTKAAIYTWHGCTLEVSAGEAITGLDSLAPGGTNGTTARGLGAGGCQSEYVAEETPMVEYANVHFALETLRQEAKATGKDGPRVLILGPEDAGKTSLSKILTAYATKVGRQPLVVNLDPTEGMLSVPGTLTATAFRTMIDVEEGWGSSPMSGPSAVPVKLPLVYFYPMQNPLEADGSVYKAIVSRLALSVTGRMAEDEDARETGIIVDTPGILSQSKAGNVEMINHIVTEFAITTILVIGSERLYSIMMKNFDNKPTASASAAASDERISVVKLSKSGGCVDRDAAFMKAVSESQIRTYFFGNPIPSTASAALSLSASSTTNVTLSPHAQQLDFNALAVYNYTIASAEEDEDEYDPSQLGTGDAFLPGGSNDVDLGQTPQEEAPVAPTLPGIAGPVKETVTPAGSSNVPLKKVLPPAPTALANSLLAITHASSTASPADVRDASIMGFLYVADVDAEKGKIRVLAPVGGRVPPRAIDTEGKGTEKVIALTIDDAPSTYTLDILHLLQQHDARATFFLIGSQIPGREGILHTLVKSGMELGNHAMHDEPSVSIGEEVLEREMLEVDGVIDRVYEESGVKRPRYEDGAVKKWFRPGSGFFNGWMRGLVQRLGYKIVLGSVYPHDAQIGWAGVNAWHVRSMVREGSIVVMHDRRSWTVEGLRRVLPVLKERGYRVVSLGEAMEIANAASTDGGKEID